MLHHTTIDHTLIFIHRLLIHVIFLTLLINYFQKQPPEVFCRTRCSQKFSKVPWKITVLETLFNKVAGLQAAILQKSKKIRRKRRQKMFRSWLLHYVKQYKNCCWRTCVIRKCSYTYILLVVDQDWSSYVTTINKQNSLNKPKSELKLFKK